jgi:hypothetical protein
MPKYPLTEYPPGYLEACRELGVEPDPTIKNGPDPDPACPCSYCEDVLVCTCSPAAIAATYAAVDAACPRER